MHLDNKRYRDKVVAQYFSKETSPEVKIDGVVPSSPIRRFNGVSDEFLSIDAQLVNAPCVDLNNADQYIPYGDIPSFEIDNFIIKVYAEFTSTGTTESIFGWQCDTGAICGGYLRWESGKVSLYFNGLAYNATVNETISTTPKEILAVKNGTSLIVTVDGIERINTTVAATISYIGGSPITSIGSRGSSGAYGILFNGKIAGVIFSEYSQANYNAILKGENPPTSLLNVPCSEGNGTILYDVSGNDNHGTITNAVLPAVWGTQDVFHYNFLNGYWRYNDGTNDLFCPLDAGLTIQSTFSREEKINGYSQTGGYNGASDVKFANDLLIHENLRGVTKSQSELIETSRVSNYITSNDGRSNILVSEELISNIEREREGLIQKFATPLDLPNLKLMWDFRSTSSYRLDESSVDRLIDMSGNAPFFEQLSSGAMAQITNGNLVFTGNEYYDLNTLAEYFKFLHDGSTTWSFSIIMESDTAVTSDVDVIFDTMSVSWANPGVYLGIEANQGIQMQMGRGVAGQDIFYFDSVDNLFDADNLVVSTVNFDPFVGAGGVGVFAYKDSVLLGTKTLDLDAFSTSNPHVNMRFGGAVAASSFLLKGKVRGVLFFDRAISVEEMELIKEYFI